MKNYMFKEKLRMRAIVIILIILCLQLIAGLEPKNFNNTAMKPIFDLSKPLDNLLQRKETNTTIVASALQLSPIVFYFTDLNFFNMLRYKLKDVSNLVTTIASRLPPHPHHPSPSPKIIMSLRYKSRIIDDPVSAISLAHLRTLLTSKDPSIFNHTAGIIFEWDYKQNCRDWGPGYSVVRAARVWLLLHYQTSDVKVGFGYNEDHLACHNFLLPQVSNADYILLTVGFESGVNFPESYGMFESHLNLVHERNSRFLSNVGAAPEPIYRPKLSTHSHSKRDHIELQYHIMLSRFTNSWARKYDRLVVLETSAYATQIFQGCAENETGVELEDIVIVSVDEVHGDFMEVRECKEYSDREILTLAGSLFKTIFLKIGVWNRMLRCKLHTNLEFPGNPPNILVNIDWTADPNKSLKQVGGLIGKHLHSSKIPLTGLVFKSEYLEYAAQDGDKREQLRKLVINNGIALGCLINFGPLKDWTHTENIAKMSLKKCAAEETFPISIFVWEFDVNFDGASRTGFSFPYYATNIQRKLHHLFTHKENWSQQSSSRSNSSEVIIKLAAVSSERQRQASPQNVYCQQDELSMNQYYEAVVKWAQVHGVRVILKEAVQYEGSSQPGWWTALANPPELRKDVGRMRYFEMRNYPKTMSYLPHRRTCIQQSLAISKKTVFNEDLTGIVVNLTVADGRSLRIEEIHTLLQLSFLEFKRVEVVPGDDGDGEDGRKLAKALTAPVTVWPKSGQLFIQFPVLTPEETMMTSFGDQYQNFKVLVKALQKLDLGGKGVHLSRWKHSENVDDDGVSEHVRNMMAYASRKGIPIGLVSNCSTEIIHASTSGEGNFLTDVGYIVCDESPIPAVNTDKAQMTSYLDGHLVKERALRKVYPRLAVHFRLNPYSIEGDKREAIEAWLRWFNDVTQFASAYSTKYFMLAGFQPQSGNEVGWWRIGNYNNLYNSTEYTEVESDFLHLQTRRPPTTSSWNETLYRSLEQPFVLSSSSIVWIMVSGFSAALLGVISFAGWLALRLKRKGRFLSEEEEREFREGGIPRIPDAGLQGEAMYYEMKFCEHFEVPKHQFNLDTGKILGMGNFGAVYRGEVAGVEVAVKLPLDGCSLDAFRSMLYEVKILCHIGTHENVLRLVGCYTREIGQGVIYIATELCHNGSLQGHLRRLQQSKDAFMDFQELVRFSREIAAGMGYIAEKQVVHGDLSTRNVLLDEDFTCKIGDFGLSRKMYEFGKYVKQNEEPLPWRWMAYESLKRMEFTTKSDVWSYGVTLWEIFSLGDVPYPCLSWTVSFVDEFKNGMRMSKPSFATEDVFLKMLECWNIEPEERPSFAELSQFFLHVRDGEYCNLEL